MRKILRCLLAAALCAALLCGTISGAFAAPEEKAPLQIGVISDIHYFAEKMTGNWCDAFMQWQEKDFHERYETPALLESALAALAAHARENGMKYVLLPGDLSANGEYDANEELAQRLERFEQETGLSVIVTNGNHDINNLNGFSFAKGKKDYTRRTSPAQFRELYKNLGFDLAYHTFTPKKGAAGQLSYSVRLDGGYRLLVLDVCRYSADVQSKGKDYAETGGQITDELMEWALSEIADAKADGEAVIAMQHHSAVEHFRLHSDIFQPFLVDNWQERAEAFADAGLSYVLTGHLHDSSVSDYVSDSGNVLYDISTPSLTGFPNYFREIRFDNTGDVLTADVQTFDVDCVKPVTVRGEEMQTPFRYFSFRKTYQNSLSDLALSGLTEILDKLFDALEKDGSLIGALKTVFKVDVQAIVENHVNVQLGSFDIFTSKNVMSFLDDLDKQVQSQIIKSRPDTEELVRTIVDKAMAFKVSDLPCDKHLDTYGFGHTSGPSTMEDAAYATLVDLYSGNQSIEDDPFLQDVVDYFRSGTGGADFVDYLYHILLDDVLQDALLSNLQFNINTLFPTGTLGHVSMTMFDGLLSLVLRGDKSYTNVINSVLGLGIFPEFKSIDSAADHFVSLVATDAQKAAWGETVADMIEDLLVEHGDGEDLTRTLDASPRTPQATIDNMRLPTLVTVTPGEDAQTRQISWYTRFSVTGTDIEIVPYSENPSFSGTPTRRGVEAKCERHDRAYPGADLGLIGMLYVQQPMNRHTVTLTGLEAGKRYSFRVGDAEKGWWSASGVLQTADGGDDVTILHLTDPRVQSARGAESFRGVLNAALDLVPETDLIVSSGDQVVNGENLRQWSGLLDGSADYLMRTMLLPAAGGHEDSGSALTENFLLPGVPEQKTENGVYYALDYNNVHFMVLNTNDANSKDGLSAAQLAWLQDSASGSDAAWKIVVLHKAMYAAGTQQDDKENEALRKQLKGLLPQLGVDLVLEGQDRVYLRTGALNNGIAFVTRSHKTTVDGREYTVQTDPCGTFYVVSGAAGIDPGTPTKNGSLCALLSGSVTKDVQEPVFSAIRVRGNTLYFDAYTVASDGSTNRIDSLAVEKTGKSKAPAEAEDAQIVPMLGTVEDLGTPVVAAMEVIGEAELVPNTEPVEVGTSKMSQEQIEAAMKRAEEIAGKNSTTTTTQPDTTQSNDPVAGGNGGQPNSSGNPSASNTGSNAAKPAPGGRASTWGAAGTSTTQPSGSPNENADSDGIGGMDGDELFAQVDSSSAQNGDNAFDSTTVANGFVRTFGTTGIPRLGGSAPVVTVCILFGAMLTAMLTASRKKEDDD